MSDESSKSTQSFIGRLALSSDYLIRPRQHVWRNRLTIFDFGFSILDCRIIE